MSDKAAVPLTICDDCGRGVHRLCDRQYFDVDTPDCQCGCDMGLTEANEPRSAMVLTEQEWDDLARVCSFYLRATARNEMPSVPIVRCRHLCERIKRASK